MNDFSKDMSCFAALLRGLGAVAVLYVAIAVAGCAGCQETSMVDAHNQKRDTFSTPLGDAESDGRQDSEQPRDTFETLDSGSKTDGRDSSDTHFPVTDGGTGETDGSQDSQKFVLCNPIRECRDDRQRRFYSSPECPEKFPSEMYQTRYDEDCNPSQGPLACLYCKVSHKNREGEFIYQVDLSPRPTLKNVWICEDGIRDAFGGKCFGP